MGQGVRLARNDVGGWSADGVGVVRGDEGVELARNSVGGWSARAEDGEMVGEKVVAADLEPCIEG